MFKIKQRNLIALVCAVLLLLAVSFVTPCLRTPLFNSLKGPLVFFTWVKNELGALVFFHRNYRDNQRLSKEVGLLRQKLNNLEETQSENARLNSLLSLKQKSGYKVTAARVIGRSADSWSSVVIIDKGSHSGFKSGMPAISYFGLVGRIIEVYPYASKILLVNDPGFAVSALLQQSRQEGLVSGALGTNLIMRYLPENIDVHKNDIVVTSGLNGAYPKGLPIGTVVAVGTEFSGLSRFALIRPAQNLSALEEVLIVVEEAR